MSKFTPGPWNAGRADMGTIVDGVESKWIYAGEQYVAIASGLIECEWDEVMANAHLIAAAPEMYNVLWALMDSLRLREGSRVISIDHDELMRLIPIGHAAIAKAEGR